MISDRMDINKVLGEMRALKAQTQAFQENDNINPVDNKVINNTRNGVNSVQETPNFGQLLEQAVDKVNDLHQTSGAMATAYEKGQSGVDITDVMIASQKAGVSFQAMVQVRNKLVEAYRDVMNMPV